VCDYANESSKSGPFQPGNPPRVDQTLERLAINSTAPERTSVDNAIAAAMVTLS